MPLFTGRDPNEEGPRCPGAIRGTGCQGFTVLSVRAFSAPLFLSLPQALPFFQIIGLNQPELNTGSIAG